MDFSKEDRGSGLRTQEKKKKDEALCPRLPRPRREATEAEPQQPCLGPDPSAAPFWAPTLPALPLDNVAFQGQTKASLKGENCVSMAEGRGAAGGEGPAAQTGLYLCPSDTTQFDFPHKRSNNISVTVNYAAQKPIKGPSASTQPLLCGSACAQISRLASQSLHPCSSLFTGAKGTTPKTTGRVPISAHRDWSPHQNNSQSVS